MPLLVTHGSPNGDKFEVIDLYNDNSICENLDDDSIDSGYTGTGGLVNKQPLFCVNKYCYGLGQSNKVEMNVQRDYSSSIVIGDKVSSQTIDIIREFNRYFFRTVSNHHSSLLL